DWSSAWAALGRLARLSLDDHEDFDLPVLAAVTEAVAQPLDTSVDWGFLGDPSWIGEVVTRAADGPAPGWLTSYVARGEPRALLVLGLVAAAAGERASTLLAELPTSQRSYRGLDRMVRWLVEPDLQAEHSELISRANGHLWNARVSLEKGLWEES